MASDATDELLRDVLESIDYDPEELADRLGDLLNEPLRIRLCRALGEL